MRSTPARADAPTDAAAFVQALVDDIHKLFSRLGELDTLEAESDGNVEVVTLLKLALTSELEAAEIAAYWLPTTPEIDAKTVLSEQCADELRHYNLIRARLEELGENLEGFDPLANGHSPHYQYLRGLRTTPERIAAGPFATEAIAEVRNAQFIRLLPLRWATSKPRVSTRPDHPPRREPPSSSRPGDSGEICHHGRNPTNRADCGEQFPGHRRRTAYLDGENNRAGQYPALVDLSSYAPLHGVIPSTLPSTAS